MINGAHAIIYSTNADADRTFFAEVLALPSVDAGGGWLIFGLPPSEVAVHPADGNGGHELYLMCEDIDAFVTEMAIRGLTCTEVTDQGWGRLTQLTLPGGGTLGVYQPRHARPAALGVRVAPAARPRAQKKAARKPAAKKAAAKRSAAKRSTAKKPVKKPAGKAGKAGKKKSQRR